MNFQFLSNFKRGSNNIEDGLKDQERFRIEFRLLRSRLMDQKTISLFEAAGWLEGTLSQAWERMKLIMDQHGIQEESKQRKAKKYDLETLKSKARIKKDNEMQMRVFIWAMETGGKPKEVAKYLKIGRERVYNIFRKMKKEMRMHNIWKIASRSVKTRRRQSLLRSSKTLWETMIIRFTL